MTEQPAPYGRDEASARTPQRVRFHQVLVWQDMAGLRTGRLPRFVKQYADLHGTLLSAAKAYAAEVEAGNFPAPEHTF